MRVLVALLLLAGCSDAAPVVRNESASLERAAIARGVVRDPATVTPTGLYAREGDRLCMTDKRIGVFIDYGDGIGCSGRGGFARKSNGLQIELGRDCTFEAAYDGDRVRFPGALPAGCERLCTRRASLAGLDIDRLSDSASEAAALRDPAGRALCG